jgi:glycosyltransferase involved in cell wall biosynthesis
VLPEPIHVLHLGSPSGLYGAERWILALARHLDSVHVRSTVGVIRDAPELDPPLIRKASELGFDTHAIDAPGRFNWKAVTELRQYLLDRHVDVLHTHFYKTDLIGLFASRGTSCRLVTTPHGWSIDAGYALKLYEAMDRVAFRWFDAVVPLSQDLYTGLSGVVGSNRLKMIPNGVDVSEIDAVSGPSPEALAWRERAELVVGYIGQLIARKRLDVLLRAFASLSLEEGRPTRLAIVGEGDQRASLEALAHSLGISERVSFLGYRADRLEILKGFDVFALPSRLEGVPRCLMEAMAARVPVVASDIPGSRELLGFGEAGLLFPLDDVSALTARLAESAREAVWTRLAATGRERVLSEYSATAMALQYTELYRELSVEAS